MDLNLDALANAIIEEYKQHTGDKKLVENFISSVGESGTYSDVYKLAKKAGLNLEQAIINQWTFEADEVYFGTMKELLKKTTGPMHDDIAKACQFIQDNMNKAAGVKLKSQLAPLNEYDLGDIAERMKNQGITKLSGELQTLGCKMVDDNQQANIELQTSVGFEIVVSRKYDSIGLRSGTKYAERCKICVGLEGTHQFRSTREARKSGVFARHPGCGCIIDYYSKQTGRKDYNIQNYNNAKVSESITFDRKEQVHQNLAEQNKLAQKHFINSDKDGIIKLKDIYFPRSVGGKWQNYDVVDFATGEVFHFAEGETLYDAEVFAGYGTHKPLRMETIEKLNSRHKVNIFEEWQHAKGKGVLDYYGEPRRAEVHWFQSKTTGKVDFKVKEWFDD